MARGRIAILPALALLVASLASCRREDPHIRDLTRKAAQADEAAQRLREAWRAQHARFLAAGAQDQAPDAATLVLTDDQRRVLEARVNRERGTSRRSLLQEILDKDHEIAGLRAELDRLRADLPSPDVARLHESHYGLAMRFLRTRGLTESEARERVSRASLHGKLAPGFEVYHFYSEGAYGTWVAQGMATVSPTELNRQAQEQLTDERQAAQGRVERFQRELAALERQKRAIDAEIADVQDERARLLAGRVALQADLDARALRLNALHYLVGVRADLEREGIIQVPLLGPARAGRAWRDALFTRRLDLREATTLTLRAGDLGLARMSRIHVVPGSYVRDEHYRLTLSPDRQAATVEFLALDRFRNDKVVFAVSE